MAFALVHQVNTLDQSVGWFPALLLDFNKTYLSDVLVF